MPLRRYSLVILTLVWTLSYNIAFAQQEILVTAVGRDTDSFTTPYTTSVLSAREIQMGRQSRTLPEIFRDDPGVLVQKTSNGQGSPYIRGFTGFRTLLLVDGIRVNNSIFREGPNQYWNTLDHFTIQQLEIVKGPSSVLYGSDSIGGTVNVRTFMDSSATTTVPSSNFHSLSRLGSADSSWVQRLAGNVRMENGVILHAGFTRKNYGDVEAGEPTGLQPKTGYDETDFDLRLNYQISDTQQLVLAHHEVNQDDAWRTHRTREAVSWRGTSVGSDRARIFDHDRSLSYAQYLVEDPLPFMDSLRVSVSQQTQSEMRERVRSNRREEFQGIDVDTFGISAQAQSESPFGYLVYGIEYYADDVDSFFRSYNPDGTFREERLQGPVGDDASNELLGIYLQDEVTMLSGRSSLILGLRYTRAEIEANEVLDPFSGNASSASGNWSNLAGSVRYSHELTQNLRLYSGISQGFRAPNLSDITRLDTARTNEIETPSSGLEPEDFIAYELGIKLRKENAFLQAAAFYTDVRNQIIRFPTGATLDGDNEVQKSNAGNGFVRGIEINGHVDFNLNWRMFAGAAWTEGEISTFPTSAQLIVDEPIDRMLPNNGIVGLRWNFNHRLNPWAEAHARIVDAQRDLSTRDAGDTSRIPPGGTPGYVIYNLRAGITLNRMTDVSLAVENISDKDYRVHGSGQNEAGRNFLLSLDLRF